MKIKKKLFLFEFKQRCTPLIKHNVIGLAFKYVFNSANLLFTVLFEVDGPPCPSVLP